MIKKCPRKACSAVQQQSVACSVTMWSLPMVIGHNTLKISNNYNSLALPDVNQRLDDFSVPDHRISGTISTDPRRSEKST